MSIDVFFKKIIGILKNVLNNLQFLKPDKLVAKLKEMALDIIYRLYTSVENILLKKFYVEFEFYTQPSKSLAKYNKKYKTAYLGDFKCTLPLILMVKHRSEAEYLVNEIKKSLEHDYMLSVIGISTLEEVSSDIRLQQLCDTLEKKFVGAKTGKIEFWTFKFKKDVPGIFPRVYDDENTRMETKDFRYVKSGPNSSLPNWDFIVKFFHATDEL